MEKFLKLIVLIDLIFEIVLQAYKHNIDACTAYFLALMWFVISCHLLRKIHK